MKWVPLKPKLIFPHCSTKLIGGRKFLSPSAAERLRGWFLHRLRSVHAVLCANLRNFAKTSRLEGSTGLSCAIKGVDERLCSGRLRRCGLDV